jgi:hypothetical protein
MKKNSDFFKKKIIFVTNYKLTKSHHDRFDLSEFEKLNIKIEVHEVGEFINQDLDQILKKNFLYKNSKSFKNYLEWKNYFEELTINCKNQLFVINTIGCSNLKSLKLNLYLKKNKKIKVFEFSKYVHPFYESTPLKFNRFFHFLKIFFLNFNKVQIYLNNKISHYLQDYLKIFPTYLIRTGNKDNLKFLKKNGVQILNGNSYDYNLYLKRSVNLNLKNKKIGLYLDSPTPIYDNDNKLVGDDKNVWGTPKKWYSSLNEFFNYIEKLKNIEIKIAPHPKIKYEETSLPFFFNRKFTNTPLAEAAEESSVIIGRNSAGFSFAAIYKIPAIFVYTNELKNKKNVFMYEQKLYANEMGLEPYNIDNKFQTEEIEKLFYYNSNNYDLFIERYLTSRTDKMKNYEVIANEINKLNNYA